MNRKKIDGIYIYYNEKDTTDFYTRIRGKDFSVMRTLKDDQRSLVQLIRINGKRYIYKVPREKNRRKWQRFISLFRGGESMRECCQLEKLMLNGFSAPKPYLAAEKKVFGMTVDSFSVSEYIESREGKAEDLDIVCKTLKNIHGKGFLHGDSQIQNFLVSDGRIYLIDCKLSKNIYGKFGEAYEYIYLEESCLVDLKEYVDKNSFFFKAALMLNKYLRGWMHFKKKIRNKG